MVHPLQVKSLHMGVSKHDEILTILPYIDPKQLEQIHIDESSIKDNVVLNLDEIGQLKQWKQAKELEVERFQIPYVSQYLKHFSKIDFRLRNFDTEELISLKEIFLCSSTLHTIKIEYKCICAGVIRQRVIEAFGQEYLDINQNENRFFGIPDTNQFFRISYKYCHIHFNRIEQWDVPENAKILN